LAAENAIALLQRGIKGGGYLGPEAPIGDVYSIHRLDLPAGADAAAAEDALLKIPQDKGIPIIHRIVVLLTCEGTALNAVFIGQGLQLASAAHLAGHTVLGMIGKEEFQDEPAGVTDRRGIGLHLHPLRHGEGAGWL